MWLLLLFLIAPVAVVHAQAASVQAPSTTPALLVSSQASSGTPSVAQPNQTSPPEHVAIDRDAKIVLTNLDNTLDHWITCVAPACHPGGKGIPVSTSQTIGHTNPSIDGASMLLTVTADSPKFYTDVLWSYKGRACNDCTQIHMDFQAYPASSPHLHSLEYDAFLFDGAHGLNIMWGTQWNQSRGIWQIWNEGSQKWVDTDVTAAPRFDAWNHIQFSGHRVIGDTNCNGTECLHYDTLTLNGTTYHLDRTEAAGPIHPGWDSISGFHVQIDVSPVKHGGPVTVSEYVDQANMWAK